MMGATMCVAYRWNDRSEIGQRQSVVLHNDPWTERLDSRQWLGVCADVSEKSSKLQTGIQRTAYSARHAAYGI